MSKKTLVIHPDDRSTDCLCDIYEGRGWTVLRDCNKTSDEIAELMKQHDRIIMLGHGVPYGLLNPHGSGYIVNKHHVDILREKETFSIWCWSDEFFRRYGIHGLHTGMIISEVGEAAWNGITAKQEIVTRDNELLAKCFKESIDMEPEQMKDYVLENYKAPDGEYDPVIEFNRKNIIVL